MIDINARAQELREKAQEGRVPWQERLASNIGREGGWEELLRVMAEHPDYSVRNDAFILQHRLTYGVGDTQELLTYDEARALGGHVVRGAKAIPITRPKEGPGGKTAGFETVFKFPASSCSGLPDDRYRGRPLRADPGAPESMDMFVEATAGSGAEALDAAGQWAFAKRYGLLEDGDFAPAPPDTSDLEALVGRLGEAQRTLELVCRHVDLSLKLQRHPEWAADQAPRKPGDAELVDIPFDPAPEGAQAVRASVREARGRAASEEEGPEKSQKPARRR